MTQVSPISPDDWRNLSTVLLDMDGTLLDLHFDNHFWLQYMPEVYADRKGLPRQEADDVLMTAFKETRGTLNWYCLDYWSDRLQMPVAELKLDIAHKIAYRPFVHDFLAMLKNQGKRAVIVTNAHRDSVDLKMERTELNKLVDRIISSHDYQEPKESQAFWDHLLRDEPFIKDSTLLIDDSAAVLESARIWGIRHLLTIFHPDSQQPPGDGNGYPGIHHFDELIEQHRD